MRMCRLCLFDRNDDTATRCRQCGGDMTPEDEDDDDDADSAFFHYLKIPNVGTVELVPGRAFRLGKDPRNELVLPKASKDIIATIFWTDSYDEVTVKEHGAGEAIKIDNVRLTGTRTLKGGEEVEAGALRMSYLKRATPVEGAIDAKRTTPRGAGPNPNRSFAPPAQGGRAAAGALEPNRIRPQPISGPAPAPGAERRSVGATPADVVLALEKAKATGSLRVKSDQGRGWVAVVAGAPRYAAFGELTGRAAVEAIVRLARGSCQVVRGAAATTKAQGERLQVTFSDVVAAVRRGGGGGGPRPGGPPPARPGAPPPRRPPGR